MRKLVASIERSIPRLILLPRPKVPRRVNIPRRLRIPQRRLIVERLRQPHILQDHPADIKLQWLLRRIARLNQHLRIRALNRVYRNPITGCFLFFGSSGFSLPTLLLRRNPDLQPPHLHRNHASRRLQQLPPPRTELKMIDHQHRWSVRPRIWLRRPRKIQNPQPTPRHQKPLPHRDLQPIQLHRRMKPCRKRLHHLLRSRGCNCRNPHSIKHTPTITKTKNADPSHNNHRRPRHWPRLSAASIPVTLNLHLATEKHHLDRSNKQSHRLLRSGETPAFCLCSCPFSNWRHRCKSPLCFPH